MGLSVSSDVEFPPGDSYSNVVAAKASTDPPDVGRQPVEQQVRLNGTE